MHVRKGCHDATVSRLTQIAFPLDETRDWSKLRALKIGGSGQRNSMASSVVSNPPLQRIDGVAIRETRAARALAARSSLVVRNLRFDRSLSICYPVLARAQTSDVVEAKCRMQSS